MPKTNNLNTTKRPSHPVWPLPALGGRSPVIVSSYDKTHGIDLAYARETPAELRERYPLGTNGTEQHFMPDSLPAFAVADGVIRYAGKVLDCYSMMIDHCNGWASYYTNLEHMFATPTSLRRRSERVKAGDPLGYVGASLPGGFKCLHFELWKLDEDHHFTPVDPIEHMSSWVVLPWTQERPTPTDTATHQQAA